jgi:hypothetical protein
MKYLLSPKEKAKSIIATFNNSYDKHNKAWVIYQNTEESKRCALLLVNEILELSHPYTIVYSEQKNEFLNEYTQQYYWMKVKQHIEEITN